MCPEKVLFVYFTLKICLWFSVLMPRWTIASRVLSKQSSGKHKTQTGYKVESHSCVLKDFPITSQKSAPTLDCFLRIWQPGESLTPRHLPFFPLLNCGPFHHLKHSVQSVSTLKLLLLFIHFKTTNGPKFTNLVKDVEVSLARWLAGNPSLF